MEFFVDTANIKEIKEAIGMGFFTGITINPVLIGKETKDYKAHAEKVLNIAPKDWEISLEVKSGAADEMAKQAKVLSSWYKRIRFKIPTTVEGLKAAVSLLGKAPLNMTIVKNTAQGLTALALLERLGPGDMVISVFCGRMRQAGYNWQKTIEELSKANRSGAKILAASIKSAADISDAVNAGADIITAPLDVYKMTLSSPIVEEDIAAFDLPFKSGLSVPK
jgi:transaldolase